MKKNLQITDYGMDGVGIAHDGNKTLFLPNTLLGELVSVDKQNNVDVLQQSPHRTTPTCPYYFECGGCNLGCMDEVEQQNYKTKYVQNCFAKYKIDLPQKLDYLSNYTFNYRNKISFGVRCQNGKNIIGLFQPKTHTIVQIEECQIVDKRNKQLLKILRDYLSLDGVQAYDEQTKQGNLRNIVARFCNGGVLVCIVGINVLPPSLDVLYNNLKNAFGVVGLSYCQNKNMRTILTTDIKHLYGEKEITTNKASFNVPITIGSFVQVDDDISEKLYEYVTQQCDKNNIVFDLYSGAGLMTAILSQKSKLIIGVESNYLAVQASCKLQQNNNVKNVKNIWGKVEDVLPSVLNNDIRGNKFFYNKKMLELNNNLMCVLDPPRKGCDNKVLQCILEQPINKIVYISCNPLTLARDVKILSQKYLIKSLKLFDMFQQTSHIESVVVLEEKTN